MITGHDSDPRKSVKTTRIKRFVDLFHTKKKFVVCYGGAGSGKSVAIAQHICKEFVENDGLDVLITRKTTPSLKLPQGPWDLCQQILSSWNIPYTLNQANMSITFRNSRLVFKSVDDPNKFKSSEYNIIWMEEVTDFDYRDYKMLKSRLRKAGYGKNKMYMSFNPVDHKHWCVKLWVTGTDPKAEVMHSNYMDNRFLSDDYVQILLDYMEEDENFYRVYTLGEPGVLRNIIWSKWETLDFQHFPLSILERDPDFYGLDFGFNNAMVLLAVWEHDGEYYVHEMFYQTHVTVPQLIDWMNDEDISQTSEIYADPSRSDNIEEIHRAGYNCKPANNKVKEGIGCVNSFKLIISTESCYTIEEIQGYKWKEDKDGNALEVPVKINDHAMDALRYAIYTSQPESYTNTLPETEYQPSVLPAIYNNGNLPRM